MALDRRRASDQIIQELRKRIAVGVWKDGERLPTERQLADEFEVSPNTIREAIRALGALGLVEVRQGSGAYVRLAPAELLSASLGMVMALETVRLADVVALSRHLHLRVVDLAVERATEDDLEILSAVATLPVEDARSNTRQVSTFLQGLVTSAHDPLLGALTWILDSLIIESVSSVDETNPTHLAPDLKLIRADWERIVEGIRARDVRAARAAIESYFDSAQRITISHDELRDTQLADERWAHKLQALSSGAMVIRREAAEGIQDLP